jgi:intracellular septation protein
MTTSEHKHRKLSPNARLAVDFGPLVVFFVANARANIFVATGAFMAAMAVAIGVSWAVERRVAMLPLVTLGIVLVFGGLTLWWRDETFIKVKVTVIEALIGATLLVGLAFKKLFAKSLLGMALAIDDEGWRIFTVRFALFSFGLAALNEVVWRTVSTDHWVWFKVGGVPLLTIAFMATQMPLLQRHSLEREGQ